MSSKMKHDPKKPHFIDDKTLAEITDCINRFDGVSVSNFLNNTGKVPPFHCSRIEIKGGFVSSIDYIHSQHFCSVDEGIRITFNDGDDMLIELEFKCSANNRDMLLAKVYVCTIRCFLFLNAYFLLGGREPIESFGYWDCDIEELKSELDKFLWNILVYEMSEKSIDSQNNQ